MLRQLASGLVDLVYPPLCLLCAKRLDILDKKTQVCRGCQGLIQHNRPPFCGVCSRPLRNARYRLCEVCAEKSFSFDRAWSACLYTAPMRRLIHLFKYGHKTGVRRYLGRLLTGFVETYRIPLEEISVVTPVPLHPARMRERGFNQSLFLAEDVARHLGVPCLPDGLRRVRNTTNQAALSKKERWTNIRDAFKINCFKQFRQKDILVVDDLFTTGATASEVASVLKDGGARSVTFLTVAMAESP